MLHTHTPKPQKLAYTPKPSPLHIAQDLRLLSIMLRASISLQEALATLEHTSQNPLLTRAYKQILAQLQIGASLPNALQPFSHIFSPMGIALIHSGAESGNLSQILEVLSRYFHTTAKTRSSFLKALFYPIFVLLGIMGAFIIIALFVIPQFSEVFASFGVALPISTQALIFASSLMQDFWWAFMLLLLALTYVGIVCKRSQNVIYIVALRAILRTPLFGRMLVYRDLWGYFLGFFYLYQARIDFHKSLPIALSSVQNPVIKQSIAASCKQISLGLTLDRAFVSCVYIDPTLQSFLTAAQKSGELECVLELCAQYCQDIYEQQITKILALIEPFSTIVIALFVGWLAFGIFLPIWELGSISL